MKNLEIIKNKNGGYGIQDLDTGKVIIPAMYEKNQLENIIEIIPLSCLSQNYSSDVYVLKGLDIDNNEVYGLYNSITNDFIEAIYESISLETPTTANSTTRNSIKLVKDGNMINYNLNVSQDNALITRKVKMFTNDNKTYGLITIDGKEIIPAKYLRKEIFNIGDIVEVNEGLYILKDKDDLNRIVGFYDSTKGILKKGTFTNYEIISNVLVFRNRIEIEEQRKNKIDSALKSKTYISLYDPKNGRYIDGDYYDAEVSVFEGDGYRYEGYRIEFIECLREINGVLILNSRAFYDTRTGYWQDQITCYEKNGKIKIKDSDEREFIGYYDIEQKSIERFMQLACKGLKEYTLEKLYLSDDKKKIYFDSEEYPVEEYSDFIMISDKDFTILLDKGYKFLSYRNEKLNILEIKPETVEQLGIPSVSGKSVYIIESNLYTFRKSGNSALKGSMYPFVKVSSKAVGAVEYDYGICSVEADCDMELDYKLDELERQKEEISLIVKNAFYQDETLMEEYPKLVKKKN